MNIIKVIKDFFIRFKPSSWAAWMVLLKALFAIGMTAAEQEIFSQHTGRMKLPTSPLREAWLVVGRRGGKSLVAALVAVFLACFCVYSQYLAPGEVATIMVIAADRRQSRVVMRYILGLIESVPMLKAMVVNQTKDTIELNNRVVIEVHTCNFRAVRGYTIAAAICDEIAFWRSEESANPDTEILNAIRPGLLTIPNSLLLCISSPYARRGALWEAFSRHYGKDGDSVLVWKASTREMNPTVDEESIQQAYAEDEPRAKAEYGAEFRTDVELFVSREALEEARILHRVELPYCQEFQYHAFTDPSGGQADSFTLGIAHRENGRTILDLLREVKPPFSPDVVTGNFALQLKAYRINSVVGDRYAGEWPRERFRVHGIEYKTSILTKSEIYKAWLPEINSGKVELLDEFRLFSQLIQLERRTGSGGREIIDHPPGGHDDLANVAAGACLLAVGFGGPSGGPSRLIGL
jgi:hypothetical protein